MTEVLRLIGIALIGGILALTVKKQAPENAMLISVACGVVMLLALLQAGRELIAYFRRLSEYIPSAGLVAEPLVKSMGIAVTAHIGAELCRDCEQKALAAKVELSGTAACILVMLPLAEEVLKLIGRMV